MNEMKSFPLKIEEPVQALLNERGIREENIQQVISFAESRTVFHLNRITGRRLAYLGTTNVTYWVEYDWDEDICVIFGAYSHRMKILEGFNMPSNKAPEETDWLCGKCGVLLELAAVKLAYLDENFVADLPACPSCQRVLVSEENAVDKMALAEKMLEDK